MFKNLFIILLFNFLFGTLSLADINIKARTAILQDYQSGEILYEKDPDISIYPASMTKIMTAIIAFDLIKSGDISLKDKFGKDNLSTKESFFTVRVDDGEEALLDTLKIIIQMEIKVKGTKVLRPSLDDVYLKYTGKRLEDLT